MLAIPTAAPAQVAVGVSVSFGPPELPVYEQPVCPAEGYLWVPGYWQWDGDDYFWVPGTWVEPPQVGFLWTPGYWAWRDSGYVFTAGYWGPTVGFYGGINYGFGYFGHGFEGGRWEHDHFYYNQAVTRVNVTVIHNTYNTRVTNITETRVSYNGGNGGIQARASAQEEAAARERHVGPVAAQTQHVQEARNNRELRAQVNHGAPPIAATQKPASFSGAGVTKATRAGAVHNPTTEEKAANERAAGNSAARPATNGTHPETNANNARPAADPNAARPETHPEANANRPANERPAANAPANRPNPPTHAADVPAHEKLAAPNTGDAKRDQKYQQQQDKLAAQQQKEHVKLQQQQEREHQQVAKNNNPAKQQQMEQKHAQQTQQMEQRHDQQLQKLQQRQQPKPAQEKPQPKPQEKPEKP